MKKKRVFIDSDVIISSLISTTGAAYYLINVADLELFVSNKSIQELEEVAKRLNLNIQKLRVLIKSRFKAVKLTEKEESVNDYTFDPDDRHILVGSMQAKAKFLISYNIKHFKVEKIADDLKIVVLTPARFLQHLRSIQ